MAVSPAFQALALMVRNARPGGIMNAFWEPPMTTSRPQPSISSGMVPIPVMASTTKIAPVFRTASAMRRTSCAAPVEVSDACTKTPARRGLGFEGLFHTVGRDRVAVLGFEHGYVQTIGLGDFDPALAEFSGGADDHLIAARKEIGNRAIERAGAGGGEDQGVV